MKKTCYTLLCAASLAATPLGVLAADVTVDSSTLLSIGKRDVSGGAKETLAPATQFLGLTADKMAEFLKHQGPSGLDDLRDRSADQEAELCDKKQQRRLKLFIEVNTGEEAQKAGVTPAELPALVALCRDELKLEIAGLMCIPPHEEEPAVHFALLAKLAREHGLPAMSMGMSADFETAIQFGATHVRVGSAIFGARA